MKNTHVSDFPMSLGKEEIGNKTMEETMATPKQIQANRLNAQQSTGPRTDEGKSIVAQNALKHGVFSKRVLLDGESEQEFEILMKEFYGQFHPQGFIEQLFCERALTAAWRLSRVTQMESMLINYAARRSLDNNGIIEILVGYQGDELSLLSRYEISLEKILFRSLAELRSLQAARGFNMETKIGFVPQNLVEEAIEEK